MNGYGNMVFTNRHFIQQFITKKSFLAKEIKTILAAQVLCETTRPSLRVAYEDIFSAGGSIPALRAYRYALVVGALGAPALLSG